MAKFKQASANRKHVSANNRKQTGRFCAFPESVFMSDEFAALKPRAVKLLVDMFMQFRGKNNGRLCVTWSYMQLRGWKSKDTLQRAKLDLLEAGFIELTRQGSISKASLYAVTWLGIDEGTSKVQLDCAPTTAPSNLWKNR